MSKITTSKVTTNNKNSKISNNINAKVTKQI